MRPGKRRNQTTRLQVTWILVKTEPRLAILFWFFLIAAAAIIGFESLVLFRLASRSAWPLITSVLGLMRFAAAADGLVLALMLWGARHSSIFSVMDRVLTNLLAGGAGAALIGFAGYTTLSAPSHRPIELAAGLAAFFGSFLFFWVFLFYGRKRSAASH